MESSSTTENIYQSTRTANPKKWRKKTFSLIFLEGKPNVTILLVEGNSDTFYTNVINEFLPTSSIKVCPVDSIKEYDDYRGLQNNKKLVKILLEKQIKKENVARGIMYGKCYGLIDKDFDFKEEEKNKYKGRLECTDCNDLETTLLSYDYDNIESCFYRDYNSSEEAFNVLKISIEYASSIGKLRMLRERRRGQFHGNLTNSICINFKRKENESDGYYKYISETKEFDFDDFIGHNDRVTEIQEIKNEISKYDENKLLYYCRGHDVFDFITCFYKKADRIKPEYKMYTVGENKVLDVRSKYEAQMEAYFTMDCFKKTNIWKFLKNISLV